MKRWIHATSDVVRVDHSNPLEHFLYNLAYDDIQDGTVIKSRKEFIDMMNEAEFDDVDMDEAFDMYKSYVKAYRHHKKYSVLSTN